MKTSMLALYVILESGGCILIKITQICKSV